MKTLYLVCEISTIHINDSCIEILREWNEFETEKIAKEYVFELIQEGYKNTFTILTIYKHEIHENN